MKNTNYIALGDVVTVRFASGSTFEGEVKYVPVATGDCWHIEETNLYGSRTGVMHYVQTFEEIICLNNV